MKVTSNTVVDGTNLALSSLSHVRNKSKEKKILLCSVQITRESVGKKFKKQFSLL